MGGEDEPSKPGTNEKQSADKPDAKPKYNSILRILSYSTLLDRCLMSVAIVVSAAAGAALPLMNLIFGRLVTSFNGYFIPGSDESKSTFQAGVNQNALYLVYLFIAKLFLSYISIYAFRLTGIRISAAIRMAYLTALFNQSIGSTDRLPPGTATDCLTTVTNTIQTAVSDKLGLLIQSIATVVAALILAFTHSWALTLASCSAVLLSFLGFALIIPVFIKIERTVIKSNSEASAVAGEVLKAVRTVKSLCAETTFTTRYAQWVDQARERGLKKSIPSLAHFALVFFSIYANMALTFWFGIRLYHQGHIGSVGGVIIVLFSILLIVGSAGGIVAPVMDITKAASIAPLCFKVIDGPQLKQGGLKAPAVQSTSDIRFENVRFSYPGRPSTEVLRGLSLTVPAGKTTALVGASGCGKSTIVALLERWYDLSEINKPPLTAEELEAARIKTQEELVLGAGDGNKKKKKKKQKKNSGAKEPAVTTEKEETAANADPVFQNSGRILLGEFDLEAIDRKWWRSQIGLVQQEPFLFNESIHDNVARGLIGSPWEDEPLEQKQKLVKEACREAFADEFIQRLPGDYETMVGESGMRLSGGQRQRLAIARSIIRRPPVLILDEATSSVDVHSERIVEAALEQASKNRTTIAIAHRLSTIQKADHIVVLRDGVAVEEGTHAELISRKNGVYAGLVEAQQLELGDPNTDHSESLERALVNDTKHAESTEIKDMDSTPGGIKPDPSKPEATAQKTRGFITAFGLLLFEQRRRSIIYAFILTSAMGGGAAYAVQAYLFSHLVVIFQYTGDRLVSAGNFWSLMFFVLSLGTAVAYGVLGFGSNSLSVYVSTTYREESFRNILNKPIPWFDDDDHSSGTLTSRLSNDPKQLEEILGTNMALPLVSVFNIVGCSIISFVFGWKLALVAFFAALPVIVGSGFLRVRYETQFEKMNAKVFAESSKFAADSIGAFRTVTAFTMEQSVLKQFRGLLDEHVRKAFKRGRFAALIFALSSSLELCCMALAFYYGGQLLGDREYNVMQFFIVYIAIVQGGQAAGQFMAFGPNIAQATAAANRIFALRGEPEVVDESKASPDGRDVSTEEAGVVIEFRDVGFSYPTNDIPVYRSLSFNIASGDYVAFVGPSGCGKTTIVSLLERFYKVSSGQILIDGVDMSQIPLNNYRSACALVSQEPTIFNYTVRENLVLGLPNGATLQEIEDACRAAEIYDFVSSLPQGFDTPLSAGTHASLSGGQKQRLCIARALLRKPRLLILDEATSSLDSQSEGLVQKAIEKVAENRRATIVVVAHRLATVQNAGRIFVLGAGGKIVEDGTHSELLQKGGTYWSMCNAQALNR